MKGLDLFFAARPLLHLPVWSIYLITLHHHLKLSGEQFGWVDVGMLTLMSLVAAGTYFLNQVHDADSDRLNQKVGFLQRGYLSTKTLMIGFIVTSVAGLGLALMISAVAFGILLQAFLLGYAYSAPPLRLKDRAVWGLLANAFGIGFLSSLAVMPDLTMHNLGLLGWDSPYYFASAVGGIYLLTTIPDAEGDRRTGKRTAAVAYGVRPTLAGAVLLFVLATAVAWMSQLPELGALAAVAALLSTVALIAPASTRLTFLATKAPILLLALMAAVYFWGFALFMIALLVATRLYYRRRFGLRYPELAER